MIYVRRSILVSIDESGDDLCDVVRIKLRYAFT